MLSQDPMGLLAHLGGALWSEPIRALHVTQEALAAASLLDLSSEDDTLNRTVRAVYERASRTPTSVHSVALNQPFFRLFPEERLILIALHLGKWSYHRLSHVLGDSVEHIQELAWNARLFLAGSALKGSQGRPLMHPTGSTQCIAACPEWSTTHPWTQRYLDRELGHKEELFLQERILKCDGCKDSMQRCREIYYAAEKSIPMLQDPWMDDFSKNLRQTWKQSQTLVHPWEMPFRQSLQMYFRKTEAKLAVTLLVLFLISWTWKLLA